MQDELKQVTKREAEFRHSLGKQIAENTEKSAKIAVETEREIFDRDSSKMLLRIRELETLVNNQSVEIKSLRREHQRVIYDLLRERNAEKISTTAVLKHTVDCAILEGARR